jgi:hypothetical protein
MYINYLFIIKKDKKKYLIIIIKNDRFRKSIINNIRREK